MKQVGMSAQCEIDPHNVNFVAIFDSGKDQRYQMLAVKKPASLKRLRTSKTNGWSMMGADVVDGIAVGEMTLRYDGGKGPRRMGGYLVYFLESNQVISTPIRH